MCVLASTHVCSYLWRDSPDRAERFSTCSAALCYIYIYRERERERERERDREIERLIDYIDYIARFRMESPLYFFFIMIYNIITCNIFDYT